jgi:hypothetical protein
MKLALALSRSLGELYASVDSEELTLWEGYHALYGLPQDRIEATVAMAGAAICQVQGGKVKAIDLIPQFARPTTPAIEAKHRQIFRDWVDAHNTTQNKA